MILEAADRLEELNKYEQNLADDLDAAHHTIRGLERELEKCQTSDKSDIKTKERLTYKTRRIAMHNQRAEKLKNEIKRVCEKLGITIPLADGLDHALIGITRDDSPRAVYSYERVIDILVEQGMTIAEADEYHEYNIAGAYMGEHTPMFISSLEGIA